MNKGLRLLMDWLDAEPGRTTELAHKFGITTQAISRWRRMGVPRDKLLTVAKLTGIPVERLIDRG
jgi:hypothetical protein